MNRFEKYRTKHKHPCANCGSPVLKNSKRCKSCDREWRKNEMSKNPVRLRHGYSTGGAKPEYYVWTCMIQRCTNPNSKQYKDYGGRGIKVCKRWMMFDNFIADMGSRPEGTHPSGRATWTLERKDSNKDYEPGNCAWATYKDQNRNRRKHRRVTHYGKEVLLAELVEQRGLDYKIVHQRLSRGWTIEQAIQGSR